MLRSKLSLAICAAIIANNTYASVAEETKPNYNLEQITVIGTALDSEADTTQSIDIISQDEIQDLHAHSVTDILKHSPNVEVTGGPNTAVKSVTIRGLDQAHINLNVDGARQSYSHSKKGSWAVNPDLLKSISVINGTSSGAAAGAIKLEFLSAYDLIKPDESIGMLVKSGFRSNDSQQDISSIIYGIQGEFDWLFAAVDRTRDPFGTGGSTGTYSKTGGEDSSYLIKTGYNISDDKRIEMSAYLDKSKWYQVRQDYGNNTRDYTSAVINYSDKSTANDFINLKASVYINQIDTYTVEYQDQAQTITTDTQDITDDSYGFIVSNDSILFEESLLHYGVSGHFTKHTGLVNSLNRNNEWVDESAESEPSADSHQVASWMNAQINLGHGFELLPNIRYDEFYVKSSNAIFNQEPILRSGRTERQWSKGLRLTQEITPQLTVFTSYDEAMTAPGLSELFTSGRGFKPNPNLKSERSQNKEIGMTLTTNGLFLESDNLLFKANIFQNDIKDYIGTDYSDPSYKDGVKVNRDKIRLRGGELLTQYIYESWIASASYGMTVGEDLKTGLYLSDMPSDKFVVQIDNQMTEEWKLGGKATHALKRHRVPTASVSQDGSLEPIPENKQEGVPSWTTVDVYAKYVPIALPDLTMSMSISNLFDEAYAQQNNSRADSKAEFYEEGRSLNMNIAYNF